MTALTTYSATSTATHCPTRTRTGLSKTGAVADATGRNPFGVRTHACG
jgi:hypothetical protein